MTPGVPVAPRNILIVDGDEAAWAPIATDLSSKGHVVEFAGGVREAEARLARSNIDVVLCKARLPDGSGADLVRRSRLARSGSRFVVVTDCLSAEGAVEAMRAGAVDYLATPLRDVDAVLEYMQLASAIPAPPEPGKTLKQHLRDFEVQIILQTVADERGDAKLAAERLGIGVSSLYRKLKGVPGRGRLRPARTAGSGHRA